MLWKNIVLKIVVGTVSDVGGVKTRYAISFVLYTFFNIYEEK